jgi:hypothetical protein
MKENVICQCGCNTFKVCIDLEYKLVLLQCSQCGYVETEWFDREMEFE